MYSHSRFTSESSNSTNESESTEQTDISDDTVGDCAKTSKPRSGQCIGQLDAIRAAPAIDSNVEYQRRNVCPLEGSKHDNFFYLPSEIEESRYSRRTSQGRNIGLRREAVPLLVRSERDYAVQDLIRSEEFKKIFEIEYSEIVKFRKNYKSLKKIFLTLAGLNIILIICAVSVMPVMLVFALGNSHETEQKTTSLDSLDKAMEELLFEKLDSPRAKAIIRQHVPCDECRRLSDKIETSEENIQKVWKSIYKLEDGVIALQRNGSNNTGNIPGQGFQKTQVHERVESNNHLINKMLNWKRSSIQLVGGSSKGQVDWWKDVSNGDVMTHNNREISVKSGGTYYIYIKIKYFKNNCTENEMFAYDVMKKTESTTDVVSNIKQRCSVHARFDQALHVHKMVTLDLEETAAFYVRFKSGVLAKDYRPHVFGMIEI